MIENMDIAGYAVEFDRNATAAAYSQIAVPGPEECGCWYCRNWAAGRDQIVPAAVRKLLAQLGVPLAGEIEVWEAPGEKLSHTYGGWYMIAGRLSVRPPEGTREFMLDGWRLWWTSGESYKVPQFAGRDVCELKFVLEAGDFIPAD